MTSVQPEVIRSLADLRPGDIMFSNIGGIVPGVFPVKLGQLLLGERVRIGRLSFDHVGIVVQEDRSVGRIGDAAMVWRPPRLVQAMPGGAEEIALVAKTHWTDTVAYCRLPEDYPGQADDAAAIARLFVSERVRYSFLSYGALAVFKWGRKFGVEGERLAKWIRRTRPATTWEIPSHHTTSRHRISLPVEAICSVLVDQCWTLAGKEVITGTRPQIVTPGMLAMQWWNRPGVVRGGKAVPW
jgi:hypothetical protein